MILTTGLSLHNYVHSVLPLENKHICNVPCFESHISFSAHVAEANQWMMIVIPNTILMPWQFEFKNCSNVALKNCIECESGQDLITKVPTNMMNNKVDQFYKFYEFINNPDYSYVVLQIDEIAEYKFKFTSCNEYPTIVIKEITPSYDITIQMFNVNELQRFNSTTETLQGTRLIDSNIEQLRESYENECLTHYVQCTLFVPDQTNCEILGKLIKTSPQHLTILEKSCLIM